MQLRTKRNRLFGYLTKAGRVQGNIAAIMRVVMSNAGKLGVMRPKDPKKAIDWANRILKLSDDEASKAFAEVLHTQVYTFVGWLDGYTVVDETGKMLGRIQPGDSFVSFDFTPKIGDISTNMDLDASGKPSPAPMTPTPGSVAQRLLGN